MQPSESVDVYREAVELCERLLAIDIAQMRADAEKVLRLRVTQSIENKVARHLAALIETIENDK